jgi:hypothetical protein
MVENIDRRRGDCGANAQHDKCTAGVTYMVKGASHVWIDIIVKQPEPFFH